MRAGNNYSYNGNSIGYSIRGYNISGRAEHEATEEDIPEPANEEPTVDIDEATEELEKAITVAEYQARDREKQRDLEALYQRKVERVSYEKMLLGRR